MHRIRLKMQEQDKELRKRIVPVSKVCSRGEISANNRNIPEKDEAQTFCKILFPNVP